MTPKIVDKEAKKLEILQTAMRVFSEKGVTKTKMIDIAKAAGIGKGTIYEYFSSKEDIFITGFRYFSNEIDQMLAASVGKADSPLQQMKAFIQTSMHSFFDNGVDFSGIILEFWAEGIRNKDDTLNNAIGLKELYQNYRNLIMDIIKRGIRQNEFRPVNPVTYASFLIAAMDGLMLQWVMEPELFDLDEVTEALCNGFLNGIKK